MKYFNVMVALALLISLIMNFTLSSKLDHVENQLTNLSYNQQEVLSSVNGQVDQIRHVMNDIQKQQSWISEITMEFKQDSLKSGKVTADFKWQLKEQHDNSNVVFHYAYGENDEYTSIPLEETQNGLYQVKVPLMIKIEPYWQVNYMSSDSEDTKIEMVEKRKEEYNRNALNYFVSVAYNDVVKSGEINTRYLNEMGAEYFGDINVDLTFEKEYSSIYVLNYSQSTLEKVELLTYQNGTLLNKEKLKSEGEHFTIKNFDKDEATHFVLNVTYKNGATFEKEIYRK
jgi:hypothetical protein